jgi:hypothetical protein
MDIGKQIVKRGIGKYNKIYLYLYLYIYIEREFIRRDETRCFKCGNLGHKQNYCTEREFKKEQNTFSPKEKNLKEERTSRKSSISSRSNRRDEKERSYSRRSSFEK